MTNLEKLVKDLDERSAETQAGYDIKWSIARLAEAINKDLKLINKPVETTNEQPKSRFLINYETYECCDEDHYKKEHSKIVFMTDEELNNFVSKLLNPKVTYLGW